MTFRRKLQLLSLLLALLWVPLLLVALTGALNFVGWCVLIASFLVWSGEVVALVGAPLQVKRDGGTLRAALGIFLVLYAPRLVRRVARIDELDQTPGVPALGPIRVVRGWSDGQGGWWADVEVIRDSDIERWADHRGEVTRATGLRLPLRDGENLRIEAGDRSGIMRWQYFGNDVLAGIRESHPRGNTQVRIGRLEDGTDAEHDFRDATHVAIQGMTRSGKSALGYVIVSHLANSSEVRLWGVDPNRVFLAPVAEVADDASRFVLGTDPEAAVTLLDRFVEVMQERMEALDRLGLDKFDPEHFEQDNPLDVLILEEWPSLVRAAENQDRKLKKRLDAQVARIVSEGAKAGIRVVLIGQRLSAEILAGDVRGQFGVRVTLAVDNRDAVAMLHPGATPELVEQIKQFPPGRCIFWHHRRQQIAQVDLLTYSAYRTAVDPARTPLPRGC